MPATQVSSNTDEPVSEPEEATGPTVNDHLEMALQTARDQGMSTSELMGIFFYYAHSIAESYREDVLEGRAGSAS